MDMSSGMVVGGIIGMVTFGAVSLLVWIAIVDSNRQRREP
jgi:hypothetical protein